jgi:hypothetical protein
VKPKRYLLFATDQYYPCGGWDDFVDSFADLEEAKAEAERQCSRIKYPRDFAQIIDLETGEEA